MARGGINKALVQHARAALLGRGRRPSIDAVRIELGNTGSKTTISRYLKELDAAAIPAVIQFPATMLRTQLSLCPACIRRGHLDVMHTLRFSTVCPTHGEQFISACPHCDRALD